MARARAKKRKRRDNQIFFDFISKNLLTNLSEYSILIFVAGKADRGCAGVWRSLVAHVLWEHGAEGSNPFTPTIHVAPWSSG